MGETGGQEGGRAWNSDQETAAREKDFILHQTVNTMKYMLYIQC